MNTNGIFIKGCFIGEPFNAVLLWEFRRELRLTRRLIKIAEKCIAEKETHVVNSFEGVCFYIARSIIWSSKSAFDNLVLGHFETVEMVIRATLENNLFQLVTTYCDDIWGDDFDAVTEELESIFDHFVEVYAQV